MPWLQPSKCGAYAGAVEHGDGTVDYYEWVPDENNDSEAAEAIKGE